MNGLSLGICFNKFLGTCLLFESLDTRQSTAPRLPPEKEQAHPQKVVVAGSYSNFLSQRRTKPRTHLVRKKNHHIQESPVTAVPLSSVISVFLTPEGFLPRGLLDRFLPM